MPGSFLDQVEINTGKVLLRLVDGINAEMAANNAVSDVADLLRAGCGVCAHYTCSSVVAWGC